MKTESPYCFEENSYPAHPSFCQKRNRELETKKGRQGCPGSAGDPTHGFQQGSGSHLNIAVGWQELGTEPRTLAPGQFLQVLVYVLQ